MKYEMIIVVLAALVSGSLTEQGHNSRAQDDHQADRLSSMYQIELSNLSIGLPASQSQRPSERLSEPAPYTGAHEDEARIQQMAAAMLPFVWPSFQLTRGQSLGKLRVRSLDSKQLHRSVTAPVTTTPQPMSVTWPMKYQQLSRSDRDQKIASEPAPPSAPAAASEFKPTFAELETDREPVKEPEKHLGSIASVESVMSTTSRPFKPTSPPTTTTTTSTTTTLRPDNGRGGRKRRKKTNTNGYLQQQRQRLDRQRQQLQTNKERAKKGSGPSLSLISAIAASATSTNVSAISPVATESNQSAALVSASSPSDSTRFASSQPLPRIKFKVSSAPPTTVAVPRSLELSANEARAQIPKSLSKLIEQQLAAQSAMTSSNLTTSSFKGVQQNLILLQEYFAARQRWNASSTSDGAKLMKPPTTSVSKVVRLQASGRNTSEISPQLGNKLQHSDWNNSTPLQKPSASSSGGGGSSILFDQLTENKSSQTTTTPMPASTTSTTTATITTTTTSRPGAGSWRPEIEAAELSSNKVLPDDEDSSQSTNSSSANTTTTVRPTRSSSTASPRLEPRTSAEPTNERNLNRSWQGKLKKAGSSGGGGASGNNSGGGGRNIKLFHFKRKPDMNKLPFYKKPLNYTELGWTTEEIEREQRRLLELQQFSGHLSASGQLELFQDQPPVEATNDQHKREDKEAVDEDEIELHTSEDAANQSRGETVSVGDSGAGTPTSELLLLKRKRRAKNQFDRLMAELQAAAVVAAAGELQQNQTTSTTQSMAGDEQRVVPVLRKKAEPLVMKPMFFNVNQKRRQTTTPATESTLAVTTTPSPLDHGSSTSNTTGEATRNRPIVRMRRKDNNGEQLGPLALEPELITSPWRPTRPSWTPVDVAVSGSPKRQQVAPSTDADAPEGLVLVPSGLLTPSGTHPMPLLAMTSNQQASWKPTNSGEMQPGASVDPEQVAGDQQQATGTHQSRAQSSSQLRVPRLLMKPMRPAKYSLNGYIPKPSLVQIQSATSGASQVSSPMQSPAGASGSQQQTAPAASNRNGLKPARRSNQKQAQLSTVVGRDLDSSTSNEIFSRRRGIEQAATVTNEEVRPHHHQQVAAPMTAAAQLEENKRKYVKQHQEANSFRSPTLSIQKANQIKAKLGLSASHNSIKPRPSTTSSDSDSGPLSSTSSRSQKRSAVGGGGWSPLSATNLAGDNQQQQAAQYPGAASTNRISTLDPPRADPMDDSESIAGGLGAQGHQVAGAGPFNSIPKTDFDCTNKRGQFVSGLFADVQTGCKVWHLCSNNRKYSFLCPTGTIFNSKVNSCDWKHSVKCSGADG